MKQEEDEAIGLFGVMSHNKSSDPSSPAFSQISDANVATSVHEISELAHRYDIHHPSGRSYFVNNVDSCGNHVIGDSPKSPMDIPSSPQETKPMITPLSSLNPPQPRNPNQLSAGTLQERLDLAPKVKSLLISGLTNTHDVNQMIEMANNSFSYLDLLSVDYVSFYKAVRAFISYHFDRVAAENDRHRNLSAFQLKSRYDEVATRAKEAEESLLSVETKLSNANDKLIPLREEISEMEQILSKLKEELLHEEVEVRTLEAERAHYAGAYRDAEAEMKSISPQLDEVKATVQSIEQRLYAAMVGIHQMKALMFHR